MIDLKDARMIHYRFFVNAIFFSLVLTDGSLKTGYDHLQWGKRLLGRLLTTIAQVSPLDCAEECLIRSGCLSFNYRRAAIFCELNYESGEGSNAKLSDEEGWIFSRRESWPMEITEACKNIKCAFNQKCVKNSYVSAECKIAHCHPVQLQLPQNVQNFSSEKALNLGSKHSLSCVDGYNPSGDETMECLRNGTWSDVRITCHDCKTGWICNNEKRTCYRRIDTPLTQEAAMKSCRICDSYLVEVNNEEENRWITENVLKNVSCYNWYSCATWTGANDRDEEGTFVWEHSNTRVGQLNWFVENPDGKDGKDCVDMFYDGQFNDRPCDYENAFMCEREDLP